MDSVFRQTELLTQVPFHVGTKLCVEAVLDIQEVEKVISTGQMDFSRFLDLYRLIHPALHPHLNDKNVRILTQLFPPMLPVDDRSSSLFAAQIIDIGSLGYAYRRLPSNVSRTHLWVLGRQV